MLTRLGHKRWNVEIDDWIKKSLERWNASWLGPWRSSKLTSKFMLWRHLWVVHVFTYVAPSSWLGIDSMKSSISRFSPKGLVDYFLDFWTLFALWLYLTPLKFKYVEVVFSKFVSPNLSLSSHSNSMLSS
jgi:hypothetical protein